MPSTLKGNLSVIINLLLTAVLKVHYLPPSTDEKGFPHSSVGKESACNAGDPVKFLGWEDPLEKG